MATKRMSLRAAEKRIAKAAAVGLPIVRSHGETITVAMPRQKPEHYKLATRIIFRATC